MANKNDSAICKLDGKIFKERPLWQRIVYPIIGSVLVIIGIVGTLLPILPGFVFIFLGIPLLFRFNYKWECWERRNMHKIIHAIANKSKKIWNHIKR
jgi:uncharacterized membrane protein YbaN (DUF454 family)